MLHDIDGGVWVDISSLDIFQQGCHPVIVGHDSTQPLPETLFHGMVKFIFALLLALRGKFAAGFDGELVLSFNAGTKLNYGETDTSLHLHSLIGNGSSSSVYIDGVEVAVGNAGTGGLDGLTLGGIRGVPTVVATPYGFDGVIGEFVAFPSDQSASRAEIEDLVNSNWSAY